MAGNIRFGSVCSAVCVAIVMVLGLAGQAWSAPETKTYRIDPDHTRVMFFVNHLGLSKFPGQFNGISGTIEFNFANNEASSADISIDATKVSMGQAALDQKLQGKDYFNTAKHPVITFKTIELRRQSIAQGQIIGNLTLLGVTKKVTLEGVFKGRTWNRFANAEVAGFSARAKIRRSEFGMRTMLPDIGDEVELRIEVEAKEVRPSL